MEGFNKWRSMFPHLMPGIKDPSAPLSGWRRLQDMTQDSFLDLMDILSKDRSDGFPLLKKLLLTVFMATAVLVCLTKFIRATFFSYRRFLKAPILSIDMHAAEPSMMRSPSVNTATMYRGGAPVAVIRRRLIQIIRKNPWLTARLVHENGKYSFKYSGDWDSDLVAEHLEFTEDRSLVLELDYESFTKKIERFIVPNGTSCVNRNAPLFKVSVVQNPSGFAFIMSMSHCLGDGTTFYNIYGMFDGEISSVRPLIPERVLSYTEDVQKKSPMQRFFSSVPFIARVLLFIFFEPKKTKAQIYKIQKSWVDAEKESAMKAKQSSGKSKGKGKMREDQVVSTNDVLVSWWARRAQFDFCLMAVNFRGRLQQLSRDHAGNYSGVTLMSGMDAATPAGVRTAVSKILVQPETLPTAAQIFGFNCGIATNWTTFYTEVTFGHCTLLRHMPVFVSGGQRFPAGMVIFCPKKGEMAALVGCSNKSMADKMFTDGEGPCGSILMKYSSK